uniref:Putative secreted protein n=1 Tax=Ixodes ricinus TaxID=34613 RepID=A0A6B0UB68_IXORI
MMCLLQEVLVMFIIWSQTLGQVRSTAEAFGGLIQGVPVQLGYHTAHELRVEVNRDFLGLLGHDAEWKAYVDTLDALGCHHIVGKQLHI